MMNEFDRDCNENEKKNYKEIGLLFFFGFFRFWAKIYRGCYNDDVYVLFISLYVQFIRRI